MICINKAEKRMYVPHQRNPLTTVRTEGILKGFQNIKVRVIRDKTVLALEFCPLIHVFRWRDSRRAISLSVNNPRITEVVNITLHFSYTKQSGHMPGTVKLEPFQDILGDIVSVKKKKLINLRFSLDKGHFITAPSRTDRMQD